MPLAATDNLREIVARVPNALRLLTALGIDFVEEQTLERACEAADVRVDDVLAVLAQTERPPPTESLVQFSLAALLHAHERVDGVLEGLYELAAGAVKDANAAAEYAKAAWRFVFAHTLPHLESEEEYHFPLLARAGAPLEALYLLGEDHDVLRKLARRLSDGGVQEDSTALSDEMLAVLRRFIYVFRWHADREEAILAEVVRDLGRKAPALR